MIKNIFFDWSGVINDNFVIFHKVVARIFKKYNVPPISIEELRREWQQPYMLFYKKYMPVMEEAQEMADYQEAYAFVTAQYPVQPYPGIRNTLEKFRQSGINLIILSSDSLENILSEIKQFELEGFFSDINSDIHDKRSVVKEIIRKNNFLPNETIFIGDTDHEIEAGQIAKIKTGAVTWGFQNQEVLVAAKPDFMINNLAELEKIILG